MGIRSTFAGVAAALGLLFLQPLPGHGQSETPPPDLDAQAPRYSPIPYMPTAPVLPSCQPASPWYVNAEMAVLFNVGIHINEHLYSVNNQNAVYVSPRVFVGYEFDEGESIRFTYRNLTEVGFVQGQPVYTDGPVIRRTFTVNWFDLDYVSAEWGPLDQWRLKCEAGGRFVFFYTGDRYDLYYGQGGNSRAFYAGGPHLGLQSHWALGESGWTLFSRADTAVTFGGGTQESHFQPSTIDGYAYTTLLYNQRSTFSGFQYDLNLQLAMLRSWQVGGCSVNIGLGVQAELLSFGDLKWNDGTAIGFVNVGPFARCEIGF